jgi:hypothetical protein
MSDLPTLDGAREAVKSKARNLVPWLEAPYQCDDCGVYCMAERTYDPQRAAFHPMGMAPCWSCPECNTDYVRERD